MCVTQSTCRPPASTCNLRPTCAATRPPTPTSTSSKTSVGTAAASPHTTRIASETRASSPPDATLASGANGRLACERKANSTDSAPVDSITASGVSVTEKAALGNARSGSSPVAASARRTAAIRRLSDNTLAALSSVASAAATSRSSAAMSCAAVSCASRASVSCQCASSASGRTRHLRASANRLDTLVSMSCRRSGSRLSLLAYCRIDCAASTSCTLADSTSCRASPSTGSMRSAWVSAVTSCATDSARPSSSAMAARDDSTVCNSSLLWLSRDCSCDSVIHSSAFGLTDRNSSSSASSVARSRAITSAAERACLSASRAPASTRQASCTATASSVAPA